MTEYTKNPNCTLTDVEIKDFCYDMLNLKIYRASIDYPKILEKFNIESCYSCPFRYFRRTYSFNVCANLDDDHREFAEIVLSSYSFEDMVKDFV